MGSEMCIRDRMDTDLETNIAGLHCLGDSSGWTRGLMMASVLVFVINRRSFGWTLIFQVEPMLLLQAVMVAIAAALLAGMYPAWRMGRSSPALALREE